MAPEIDGLQTFLKIVSKYKQRTTIYRGVTHEKYDLRPKVGRVKPLKKDEALIKLEERLLRRFCERSIPFLEYKPEYAYEWMSYAPHHGLPTRLLDWSRNPLVALFFAVRRKINEKEIDSKTSGNSAIYVYHNDKKTIISKENEWAKINKMYENGPFKVKDTRKFVPEHINRRIIAQAGVFTVHPNPKDQMPFTAKELDKYIIPNNHRQKIKKQLFGLGVNEASLFPDLDRIATQIEWELTSTGH
jgi:hypothetical protein